MATTVGGYLLEARLGSGSSGTVWRARRPGHVDRVVALKRLHDAGGRQLERLRREASVLASLDHPHLVRVLDVVDDGEGIALVLQLAPGGSLEELLEERGPLAPGEVVAIAAPLADALASAHRRQVVHGDVKPANVLFTSDGEPLLSDFGVARLVGRSVTADQRVAGTAEYLAPELVEGTPAHVGSDLYALGVLCYQALTGDPPYAGPTPLAVLRAADRGDHSPLATFPGVPAPLAAVVEAAIARDPAARPVSADELARSLRAAVPSGSATLPGLPRGDRRGEDRPASTRAFGPGPPAPPPRPVGPRPWSKPVLAAVAASVVIGGALTLQGDDPEPVDGTRCEEDELAVPPGADRPVGDTTGRGCESVAVYAQEGDTMVLTVRLGPGGEPARYQLGQPGDRLLLGDWNCDDLDTAARYRPSSGEVVYFDVWASEGAASSPNRTEQLPAGVVPELGTDDEGCDVLVAPA